MFKVTNIAIILFITTVINLFATYISWRRQRIGSGLYFTLAMAGLTIWTLAAGLGYAAVPLYLKILFAKIDALGYHSAIALFLIFFMYFGGLERWAENKWFRIILILIPVINLSLIVTNELHGWVWRSFSPVDNNVFVFEHGPAFIWIAVTGYLMLFSILAVLWKVSRSGSEISRRQGRLLLAASIFPVMANVVYLYGVKGEEGVDWSSITFSVTGLLFLWTFYGARLLDLVPIARDKLVTSLSDGMIVLDMQNRIIDINPAATSMIQSSSKELIGRNLVEVVPLLQHLIDQVSAQEIRTELEFGSALNRYFDVLFSPLYDDYMVVVGRLIVFRDITGRKKNELRLLQLTQAVEQSPASVMVMDVTGNIEYVNPQFSTLTGYSQDEIIGRRANILKSDHVLVEAYRDMWQTIQAGEIWEGEFLNRRKNGDLYWEKDVMAPVFDQVGNIINYITVMEDITERKKTEEDQERRFLEIQELHKNLQKTQGQLVEQQMTLAALDERKRLGRNMHDSVNQSIHSLMLFSETLIVLLEKKQTEKAFGVAERIQESGRQALKEIRLLVYETQDSVASQDIDFIDALGQRLDMVERRVGIKAEIICDEDVMEHCPPEWNENLYWMVVEALNNSLKYAQARNVKIIIHATDKQFGVEIKDDGAGFDPSQARSGGFGMRTMRERAEILGGKISVESSIGYGTSVKFNAEIGA